MTSTSDGPWSRHVFAPKRRDVDATVAVFTGIHGSRWVGNATESLDKQSLDPVQAVFAINGRDDVALSHLTRFQRESRHEVWVVVNERNIGPAGSYQRNRDLIRAPWTVFMHQDDVYLAPHLETIREMAVRASDDTVALFTALGGISEDGTARTTPPPMDGAKLRQQPPWILVPEIIRKHPFPTPAVATRSCVHPEGMAWYDSGAPDSEWFARLACRGTVNAIDDVTVLYRQPADSESSRTNWHTRAWLWSASVERILSSPEFLHLLDGIPRDQRTPFAQALLSSIPARYPSSPIFRYLQFLAAQRLCQAWDYKEERSVAFLEDFLAQWGPSAAVTSLEALSGRQPQATSDPAGTALLGSSPRIPRLEGAGRLAYRRYGYLLPVKMRSATLKAYRGLRKGAS